MEVNSDQFTEKFEDFIDLKRVFRAKNPKLMKIIPWFVFNYLNRTLHIKELNQIVANNRKKYGLDFVGASLENLKIEVKSHGTENIPESGRYIIASNHPLGGPDGMALIHVVGKVRKDVRFIVNDLLLNIENLKDLFIPVNKVGANTREMIKRIDDLYASDELILNFPFGLVSRKFKGKITDLEWKKSFITKARQTKRDIIPAYIKGRNSDFFYNLANLRKFLGIKVNIEMLYLVDEMFKQKDKDIIISFGKPIPWQTFDKKFTETEWAEKLRQFVYQMENDHNMRFNDNIV